MNASVSLRTTAAPINYVVEHLQMRRRHISKRTGPFYIVKVYFVIQGQLSSPKTFTSFFYNAWCFWRTFFSCNFYSSHQPASLWRAHQRQGFAWLYPPSLNAKDCVHLWSLSGLFKSHCNQKNCARLRATFQTLTVVMSTITVSMSRPPVFAVAIWRNSQCAVCRELATSTQWRHVYPKILWRQLLCISLYELLHTD
jgi:hypothetical protein